MGLILRAVCQCGFEEPSIMIGGGMSNFHEYCGAPALCNSCGSFSNLNYLTKRPRCPVCQSTVKFYDSPSLQLHGGQKAQGTIASWNMNEANKRFILPDTLYFCPTCKEMTMKFEEVGLFD